MKKIISLILMVAMLMSCSIIIVGCSEKSPEEIRLDTAAQAVAEASQTRYVDFCSIRIEEGSVGYHIKYTSKTALAEKTAPLDEIKHLEIPEKGDLFFFLYKSPTTDYSSFNAFAFFVDESSKVTDCIEYAISKGGAMKYEDGFLTNLRKYIENLGESNWLHKVSLQLGEISQIEAAPTAADNVVHKLTKKQMKIFFK